MYGKGTITINNITGNETEFLAYQIFQANVADSSSDPTGKVESNVQWYNADVQTAVEGVIKANDATYAGATAQEAAKWIAEHVTGTDSTTVLANATVANQLAAALDDVATADKATVTAGTATELGEGYWLFVTNPPSLGTDENGTSPIFAVVGGATAVNVTEKTGIPTMTKMVAERSDDNGATGAFTTAIDVQRGQTIHYKLGGTLPDNISTFKAYKYVFTDEPSENIKINQDSVIVNVINGSTRTPVTADTVTVDADTGVLTVGFGDLITAARRAGTTIGKDTQVMVDYTATVTADMQTGQTGEDNSAKLTYSNNPNTDGTGTTSSSETKIFTYGLKLEKLDASTLTDLAGAKFTIQVAKDDEDLAELMGLDPSTLEGYSDPITATRSQEKYVQADGTLAATPYEFTTDVNGMIEVSGLDAGTYTVTETTAPAGYTGLKNSFTVKISSSMGSVASGYSGLTNTLTTSDSDHVIVGTAADIKNANRIQTAVDADGKKVDVADDVTGMVKVSVGNTKTLNLPLTGRGGITAALVIGSGLVLVGITASHRRNQGSETA